MASNTARLPAPPPQRNRFLAWFAADTLAGIQRQKALLGILFILPAVIGLIVFVFGPMIGAFALSFFKWNVFKPPTYIGVNNFTRLFADPRVGVVFKNTFILVIMTIAMLEVLGLALALGVYRLTNRLLATFFRTAYFLPVLLSGAAVAVTLGYLFNQDFGVINYYLGVIGIAPVPWLSSTDIVLFTIAATTVWRNVGFTFIIYLGGLTSLPSEVLEAAEVDGATGLQKFFRITLPLLSPTILFASVTDIIKMLQFFDEPNIMTHGGPGDASRTVVMLMRDTAFGAQDFGYGSAIALALFAVIMVVTAFQFYMSRRWVFYK
jgi:multiple sugar transport system permease protein